MANDVKNKLKNIGATWGKARETTKKDKGFGEFVPVDVGVYSMQLLEATIDSFGSKKDAVLKLRLKWGVLDDGDDRGAVCTQFEGVEGEERQQWIQRLMRNMGIDSDVIDAISDGDELLAAFQECVDNKLVCKVKVTEKDDFKNVRVQKPIDHDEDDKLNAEEVLKEAGGAKANNAKADKAEAKGKKEEPAADEVAIGEGDRVSWEDAKGNTVEGKIVGFTQDDSAKVQADGSKKTEIKPLDALTKLEEEAPTETDDTVNEEVTVIEKGTKVLHDGKEATVTSTPPKTTKVQITYTKSKKVAMVERADLDVEAEEEAPAEEASAEEAATIDVGSKVLATIKGKDQAGVVKWLSDDGTEAKVKIGNQLVRVKTEDLAVEVD